MNEEITENKKLRMVTLRISEELHGKLKDAATLTKKSMNKFLEDIARTSAEFIITKNATPPSEQANNSQINN